MREGTSINITKILDLKTILITATILLIMLPVIYLILDKIDVTKKTEKNSSASLYMNRIKHNPVSILYRFLSSFPLTSGYIQKISRRYELICPADPVSIIHKTMMLTGITSFLCAIEVLLTFIINPNMNNFILAIYLIFVVNNEAINYSITKVEINLLMELQNFISNVSHNYFKEYHIDDAIADTMSCRMSFEMKVYAKILYGVVTSDMVKEEVERYNNSTHNKYLKMFLSQCVNVMECGDKKKDGQHLMTVNMINLKREINMEYIRLKDLRFIFAGCIFNSVVVCTFLTPIKGFAISIAPELINLYSGQLGLLYIGIVYLSSVIVYTIINIAKEVKKPIARRYYYLERIEKNPFVKKALLNFEEKHYSRMIVLRDTLKRLGETITPKQLILKSFLVSVITMCICVGGVVYFHEKNKELITENVSNIDGLMITDNMQQLEAISNEIIRYVKLYKKEEVTPEQLQTQIKNDEVIFNEKNIEEAAVEIVSRVNAYKLEYFKWYELLISLIIATVTFFLPYGIILYKRSQMVKNMEEEVILFNSIIYMMMYSDHITVMDILEQLELFSNVFKPTLRECINEYNSGDIEALEKMKGKETNESFLRLVDNLIRCDNIPITDSFNEIASDRENFFEIRKQENKEALQKKLDNIQPLSFIPLVLTLIYLIAPLVYIGTKQIVDLTDTIKSMGIY